MDDVRDVVLNNLILDKSGTPAAHCATAQVGYGDLLKMTTTVRRTWLHNLTFRNCGDDCIDANHAGQTNSRLTIGYCRFEEQVDNAIVIGLGSRDENNNCVLNAPDDYKWVATVHRCYFDQVRRRAPKVNLGYIHAYNNLIDGWCSGDFGAGAQERGELLFERNIARSSGSGTLFGEATRYDFGGSDGGTSCPSSYPWHGHIDCIHNYSPDSNVSFFRYNSAAVDDPADLLPGYLSSYDYTSLRVSPGEPGGAELGEQDIEGAAGWQSISFAFFDDRCAADLNCDGEVDAADLAILNASWGSPGCGGSQPCAADLNGDGDVNAADQAILLGAWGTCGS